MRTPEEIFRQIAETEATITASKKLLKILDEELKQSEWVESGDWYHDPMVFKRRMAYLLSCRGLTYTEVGQMLGVSSVWARELALKGKEWPDVDVSFRNIDTARKLGLCAAAILIKRCGVIDSDPACSE